jgi:Na+-transporting NADH:ubiquinone oxidoreductase subunit D
MGRAETYALGNPPLPSFLDGIGNGLGYGFVLVAVAFIRELLGAGKLFGYKIIPQTFYNAGYENMGIMLLAPGAFIVIGLLVWLQKTVAKQ